MMQDILQHICENSSVSETEFKVGFLLIAIMCVGFGLMTWFMLPVTERPRLRNGIVGLTSLELGCMVGVVLILWKGGTGLVRALMISLSALGILCFVFAFVTYFMIPKTDRSRIKKTLVWKQRDAFSSPKHFRLFVASTSAIQLGCVLGLMRSLID